MAVGKGSMARASKAADHTSAPVSYTHLYLRGAKDTECCS